MVEEKDGVDRGHLAQDLQDGPLCLSLRQIQVIGELGRWDADYNLKER